MRKIFLSIFVLVAACASAQVTTDPAIIEKGYDGQIKFTYDPSLSKGKAMVNATECYSHMGLITADSKDNGDWKYIQSGADDWGTKKEPQWTKVGSNWELTIPSIYTFFGCPTTEEIIAIAMVFHDGNGKNSKEGKDVNGNNIILFLDEENIPTDIWADFTPAAVVNETRPSGISNGIYYDPNDPTVVTLCTYAANKTAAASHVFVLGDMTNWRLDNAYQMKKDGNYFWLKLTGLTAGQEYRFQYAIERADGEHVQISDLYSEKVISQNDQLARKADPTLIGYPLRGADGGYVTVIQPGKPAFQWSQATLSFQRPNKDNLVIYEVWPYDHTAERTLTALTGRLDYIENLGVNAVELMPMCEFEYPDGWGYAPTHYFASHKACGSSEQLKTFIDECHKRGIAVIIDMVFNHATGLNPMNKLYPLAQNPWFNVNPPHGDNVFEDWNHDFEPAHEMFTRALQYWLREYKVDGFRLDLSHGICGPTYNAVDNLKDYYNNGVKAVSPDAYMILEHWGKTSTGDLDRAQQKELTDAGMMCWENTGEAYQQIAMGYSSNSSLVNANRDKYVSYCESHDEERCFFKARKWGSGSVATDEDVRLNRVPMVLALTCLLDGPTMFYHFAELGFDNSKFMTADGVWGKDGYQAYGADNVPEYINEEVKMYPKKRPEGWMKGGARMQAYQKVAQILQLRTRLKKEVFEGNPTNSSVGATNLRTIQWGSDVFVCGNISATTTQNVSLPSGTWYDYLAGGTNAAATYTLQPGEIKVFTGSKITPPVIPASYDYSEDIDDIIWEDTSGSAYKVVRNGQVLIVRDNKVYTITGARVQ